MATAARRSVARPYLENIVIPIPDFDSLPGMLCPDAARRGILSSPFNGIYNPAPGCGLAREGAFELERRTPIYHGRDCFSYSLKRPHLVPVSRAAGYGRVRLSRYERCGSRRETQWNHSGKVHGRRGIVRRTRLDLSGEVKKRPTRGRKHLGIRESRSFDLTCFF